jgi:hypothetical protein
MQALRQQVSRLQREVRTLKGQHEDMYYYNQQLLRMIVALEEQVWHLVQATNEQKRKGAAFRPHSINLWKEDDLPYESARF